MFELLGDAALLVFALFVTSLLAGIYVFLRLLRAYYRYRLDTLYLWVWRLPRCQPGHCYCRRACICLIQESAR